VNPCATRFSSLLPSPPLAARTQVGLQVAERADRPRRAPELADLWVGRVAFPSEARALRAATPEAVAAVAGAGRASTGRPAVVAAEKQAQRAEMEAAAETMAEPGAGGTLVARPVEGTLEPTSRTGAFARPDSMRSAPTRTVARRMLAFIRTSLRAIACSSCRAMPPIGIAVPSQRNACVTGARPRRERVAVDVVER